MRFLTKLPDQKNGSTPAGERIPTGDRLGAQTRRFPQATRQARLDVKIRHMWMGISTQKDDNPIP